MQIVSVDVVCDLICPWCWIGKKKLEKSVSTLCGQFQFHIRWLPFLLRPDTPAAGTPVENEDLGHARKKAELKRARRAGEAAGLDITFASPIIPSSVQAHALVQLAGRQSEPCVTSSAATSLSPVDVTSVDDLQSRVVEMIFTAYLAEGKSLTESDLVTIATTAGMDADVTRAFITDDANLADVRRAALEWTKRGVSGVPCFYINGQRMFSGAQDEEMFRRMILMTAQKAAKSGVAVSSVTTAPRP